MKNGSTSGLLISGITLILCGFCSTVWRLLRTITKVFSMVQDAVFADFDYKNLDEWKSLFQSGSAMPMIHSLSTWVLTYLQFISGIMAVLFVVAVMAKRRVKLLRLIPLVLGIVTSIFGGISAISLILSATSSVIVCLFMTIILFIIPVVFTYFAGKFYSEGKQII